MGRQEGAGLSRNRDGRVQPGVWTSDSARSFAPLEYNFGSVLDIREAPEDSDEPKSQQGA